MRFLRGILGKTRRDRIRNETIKNTLQIRPVKETMERNKLKWLGHVKRMGLERLPRRALEWTESGRRPIGRPRTRWRDQVKDDVNRRGLQWEKMLNDRMWEKREEWKRLCERPA